MSKNLKVFILLLASLISTSVVKAGDVIPYNINGTYIPALDE